MKVPLRYPFLRRGILVYDDNKANLSLILNPYQRSGAKITLLNSFERLILKRLTGQTTTSEMCKGLTIPEKEILSTLEKWANPEWNMVFLLNRPLEEIRVLEVKETKYRTVLNELKQEVASVKNAEEELNDLKQYHELKIQDPLTQFEEVETTVSHYFRKPHPILGGKNYGAALVGVLIQEGVIKKPMHILEVGGGTGIFGKCILDEVKKQMPETYREMSYHFLELSPALLKSQKEATQDHHEVTQFNQGDIERHDFKDKKFDLILCNEMIADLTTVKLNKNDLHPLIHELRIDIQDAQNPFLFNLGAITLLKTIKQILKNGGHAYLIEYGSPHTYPIAAYLKDHTEYSIHFGLLERAAKNLSLHPILTNLSNFLPFDKEIQVIDDVSLALINNYLLPFLGRKKIPIMAYTEEMLKEKLGEIYQNLSLMEFFRVGSNEFTLDPARFWVLHLKKE
ncbi:MAG: hypothetical protein A2W61_00775 [Deltaproteobacteria bacterium RIFCSPLOWO2_01_44_7]|nr:MAG: hypothetical protein A2712_05790 [Deltaproteobacteria bacterium RIFCSPHIGHO2_01_FULL_43_49]OGQ16642.1 MAG: hypothetical protein A3D22_06915 [Deltaproteobacteria bacterium RIFCSPHIGHO2_02_FULL_44_53]OGQ29780.1 MAG: hypothetical protein A3D98_09580 [Deltaproteobacteria bacterium RIFCSPHIGHO2_12_FULL_44_21]OGQ33070.1 MAG: hypothetical protein A2979_03560 [Deltaproteobacteria bacterium RIFCSPLOWO2_01_FULL_45_74]OGQ37941.1 MAG: hypothetical protein A2W61_00775 [Deltaproteobacteria bacterium 